MTRSASPLQSSLVDLEAPALDLADGNAPETMLRRLRVQNFALDRLRYALAAEERWCMGAVPALAGG